MLYRKYFKIIVLSVFLISVVLSGCVKGKFDIPPVIPSVNFTANTSIAQLKAMHDPNSSKIDTIITDIIIQGIVISNDSCGNCYKYINIQDTSGGLTIQIDNGTLYTVYKPGQKVLVKCKGLGLGSEIVSSSGAAHKVMTQLGRPSRFLITTIPDVLKSDYIFKDGLPGELPAPKVVTAINQLNANDLGVLVKLTKVQFTNAGAVFNIGTSFPVTPMTDTTGTEISVYATQYCCFAKEIIPAGKGTVVGILSSYDNAYQFIPRDIHDIYGFAK